MIFVILGFVTIAMITLPPLIKKKYWREIIAFGFLYIFSFAVCVLYAAHVELPNPLRMFEEFLDKIHFHF